MKPQHLFIVVAALLGACSPPDQESNAASRPDHREPDPVIVSKLQEIVELRERQVESAQLLVETGQGANDGVAETALVEARIALAREQGQADVVVAELRKLVKVLERKMAWEMALFEDGRRTDLNIRQSRVALLEAEIRLQRELTADKTTDPHEHAGQPAVAADVNAK